MALLRDELGERTELPSPLRLNEARQRGQVARSADLVAAACLLAGLGALVFCGPTLLEALTKMMGALLSSTAVNGAGPGHSAESTAAALQDVLWAAAPIILIPLIAAVLVNVVQVGLLVATQPIAPEASRISPATGLRRIFSGRSTARSCFTAAKIFIVVLICFVTIPQVLERIVHAVKLSPGALVAEAGSLCVHLGFRITVALVLLGLMDWVYQRWQHREDLKITRRELLDDLRRMGGDSQVANRQRQRSRQLASQRLSAEIPLATAVIASPHGPVVALRYDASMSAPRVVGRGRDQIAARIRHLSDTHGIPVVDDPQLAAALYRASRVGVEVPRKLRTLVTELLAKYGDVVARQDQQCEESN
ncbi:MAG: EscU/YscU/HrcU family type III secretion system export apparatus switch protein [Planctomycetota bacterium]|jgi:flagellar biosynthetic protein FlhB